MKVLIFSDLHLGHRHPDKKLKRIMAIDEHPDAVLLCGDNAEVDEGLFYHDLLLEFLSVKFKTPIGLVAGNHDLYGKSIGLTSEDLLYQHYPLLAKKYGATYLETENMKIGDWSIAGTYAHYDFSFRKKTALEALRKGEITLNDRVLSSEDKRSMVWSRSDEAICKQLLDDFENRLPKGHLITISHTIPSLSFNGWSDSISQDFLASYSGSARCEQIIAKRQPAYHFCGHTHQFVKGKIGKTIVTNTGATYDGLRYAMLDTEKDEVIIHDSS